MGGELALAGGDAVPTTPAQLVNRAPLAARVYEPLWRGRSLAILTFGGYDTERELATMVDWLRPTPEQRILDAACSAGLYARRLALATRETEATARSERERGHEHDAGDAGEHHEARHGEHAEIHALDHSLPFLREAGRLAGGAGVRLHLARGDVADLPYATGAFDAVTCGGSLNEFADPERALAEFGRVLRPGGALWLMYVLRADGWGGRALQLALRPGGIRFPTSERVETWAASAGLQLERAEYRRPVALALFRAEA